MAQTLFINTTIDPKQLEVQQEFRQIVPFPFNGKNISGPGASLGMNAYIGGLFQPYNYTNSFDPVNAQEIAIGNYMGLSSTYSNIEVPRKLDKPCYCLSSGFSTSLKAYSYLKRQLILTCPIRQPQMVSCVSPYNASFVGAEDMSLIGVVGITKIPIYNGYVAFALYSDLKIRDPGVDNCTGVAVEAGSNIVPQELINYFNSVASYGRLFNDENIQFSDKVYTSTKSCLIYAKLLVLNDQLVVQQILDFTTNYADTEHSSKRPDFLVERKNMAYEYKNQFFDVGWNLAKNNTNKFDYRFKNSYQGFVINLNGNQIKEIEDAEASGVGKEAAIEAMLLKMSSGGSVVLFNYGSLQFTHPKNYDSSIKDKKDIRYTQNEYLGWLSSEFANMQTLRLSMVMGSTNLHFNVLVNNGKFISTDNTPYVELETDGFGKIMWSYPVGYAFKYPSIEESWFCTNFITNYVSTICNSKQIFPVLQDDYSGYGTMQFSFNGAGYTISGDGAMYLTLPGASPTNPVTDEAFTCQGSSYIFNKYQAGEGAYYDTFDSWMPGMYPFPWLLNYYGNKPYESKEYFEKGGRVALWVPPVGITQYPD